MIRSRLYTAFDVLSLSNQYAAAATDAQRSMFLAAGQAMLAIYQGSAFDVYYVLNCVQVHRLIASGECDISQEGACTCPGWRCIRPGLPQHPKAGAHDCGPGGERDYRDRPHGRGDPVPAAENDPTDV
jgi:hypothetical protein